MVEYICKTCGKKFDHKSTYTRHINRKNKCVKKKEKTNENNFSAEYSSFGICIPKLEYVDETTCEFCFKKYSTKFNLNKHQKKCKLKEDKYKRRIISIIKITGK